MQTTKNGAQHKSKIDPNGEAGVARPPIASAPAKVKPLRVERTTVVVRGVSPLIVHAWSEKARRMMLEKQTEGKQASKKELKVPEDDFRGSLYVDRKGLECVPAAAFAQAMVSAARWTELKMTELRGVFFVCGDLLPIFTLDGKPAKATMREDMVRLNGTTADIRFRGEYQEWMVELPIEYNANAITPSQIAEMLNLAGFSIGVGEWRPEKDGNKGRFAVDLDASNRLSEAVAKMGRQG